MIKNSSLKKCISKKYLNIALSKKNTFQKTFQNCSLKKCISKSSNCPLKKCISKLSISNKNPAGLKFKKIIQKLSFCFNHSLKIIKKYFIIFLKIIRRKQTSKINRTSTCKHKINESNTKVSTYY